MSLLELLVTVLIAILILKPTDFEKAIKVAAKIYVQVKALFEQIQLHINDKIKLLELEENQQRAQKADQKYLENQQDE